ncbi:hypothetical protein F5Y09DRAFT_262501 [Xylaria sp. FL1042]|nr:hypothetical protein F5Y09DRAFT_262501 [Xylaria sp. FL1042]
MSYDPFLASSLPQLRLRHLPLQVPIGLLALIKICNKHALYNTYTGRQVFFSCRHGATGRMALIIIVIIVTVVVFFFFLFFLGGLHGPLRLP